MGNCRICKDSVARRQIFCVNCGARQTCIPPSSSTRTNNLTRLKDYFREAFRSDIEKRFDAACEFAQFDFDAAISELEEILSLEPKNPHFRSILAVFYAGAGDERLSHPRGFPGGPMEKLWLESSFPGGETRSNTKAEEILTCVTKVRKNQKRNPDKKIHRYDYAYRRLDEALNGSLDMFDKSL